MLVEGWDRATALISNPVQITVSSSPQTCGQLMQDMLIGQKQENSNMARFFYLCEECSNREAILLCSGGLKELLIPLPAVLVLHESVILWLSLLIQKWASWHLNCTSEQSYIKGDDVQSEVLYKYILFGLDTMLNKGNVTNYLYKASLHLIDAQ